MKTGREPMRGRRTLAAVLYWLMAVVSPLVAALSFLPELDVNLALLARLAAAVLAVGSLICKGLGDHWGKSRERTLKVAAAEEERRISMALGDLAATLGRVSESFDSRDREERSVEAAENVVVKLLEHRVREVRCCFYRLQWTDEELLPHENPAKNAFLQRVGSARGRGVHQARETFTFAEDDPDGIETLTRILDDKPMHEPDTSPRLTGRKYGSYLSVPVHNRGNIVGMISADSTDVGGIELDCESLLRMVGALAALGLDAETLAVEPVLGTGRGALIPGSPMGNYIDSLHEREDEGEER